MIVDWHLGIGFDAALEEPQGRMGLAEDDFSLFKKILAEYHDVGEPHPQVPDFRVLNFRPIVRRDLVLVRGYYAMCRQHKAPYQLPYIMFFGPAAPEDPFGTNDESVKLLVKRVAELKKLVFLSQSAE
ncbi:hypothetical protein [Mesorhizobium sp. M0589]|uniref:hypothetical protein n=1 Tax=Mesorhizobium sp. M0589 TaxID=2956965 RepID=UPI00333C8F52